MSHHNSFVQLNTFLKEVLFGLQVLVLACLDHMLIQKCIVGCWSDDAGEQIACDTVVERDVVLSELWQIDIVQCSKAQLVFRPVELAS